MIHINNLHKRFGDSHVLRGISCDIKPQEVVCIIGPSGSGKSTFLRCMNALETVSEGEVVVNGFAAHDRTTDLNKMRESVGMVFQRFNLFPHMTVLENLKIGAYLRKDDLTEDLNWVFDLFPRLKERSWQAGGTLSGGEQQMLAVGRALMSRPKVIMMDEPSLGLAPIIVKGIFEIIKEINKQGVTVLLIEQNANMALKTANLGYVMETGRITLHGSGEELLANEAVKAAYLGT